MAEARPDSSNAQNQTDETDKFPPLYQERARKQTRTTEKARFTRITNRINTHMDLLGSRTELKFMRTDLAKQLEECINAHNHYCTLFGVQNRPSDAWINEIEQTTALFYGRINEYIRTVPRAPSTTGSAVTSHASIPSFLFKSVTSNENQALAIAKDDVQSSVSQHHVRASSTTTISSIQLRQWTRNLEEMVKRLDEISNMDEVIKNSIDTRLAKQNDNTARLSPDTKQSYDLAVQQQVEVNHELKNKLQELETEKLNRIASESVLRAELEKQRRELHEEKAARRSEKYRQERELEDKMRLLLADYDKNKTSAYANLMSTNQPKETGTIPKTKNTVFNTTNPIDNFISVEAASGLATQIESCSSAVQPTKSAKWSACLNAIPENDTTTSSILKTQPRSVFRLPKRDLQPFNGNPKNWPDFIAIYRDLVHNDPFMSTTQKVAILKQCLALDIRDGLGHSLSNPALYHQAVEELESIYGHPQLVSRAYIQSLMQIPKINSRDFTGMLKVLQTINGAVASLKNGGFDNELRSTTEVILSNAWRDTKQVGEADTEELPNPAEPGGLRDVV